MPIFKDQLSAKEVISKLSSKIKEEAKSARRHEYPKKQIGNADVSVTTLSDKITIKISNLDGCGG